MRPRPAGRAAALLALLFLLAAAPLAAQGSPWVPLDDPRLALAEQLIARGEIRDPSPMVRPFRRADVVAALEAADTAPGRPAGRVIRRLLQSWRDRADTNRWLVEGRAGAQAYTTPRRDLLHAVPGENVLPYVDLRLEAVYGGLVAVSRPAIEPRLSDDPDWRGRRDLRVVGRMAEAYLAWQGRFGGAWFGQLEQNWGPVGVTGIPIGNFAYARPYLGVQVGGRTVRLLAQAGSLRDETDSAGRVIKRYHFGHRLAVRLSDRLELALWETTLISGEGRSLEGRFINPASLLLLANQYGEGDPGNVMVGLDAHWRAGRAVTAELQLAIDDLQYQRTSGPGRYPNRWALTAAAFGPLGARGAWRALYTQASTLAFRATNPFESFVERGVGVGRGFADMDQLTLTTAWPVRERLLVTPELTVQRQGNSRLADPIPTDPAALGATPQILSKPVETLWRAAVNASGRLGRVDLLASAGLHHLTNAGHVASATRTRFEGRLQATIALGATGRLD